MSAFKRPFMDVLSTLRRGKTHTELTDALNDLVQRCQDTGKKGVLTLTLTVDPDKDIDDGRTPVVKVHDQITVKTPRKNVRPTLYYVADGNLERNDPAQDSFPGLTEVPTPTSEAAEVADRKAAR